MDTENMENDVGKKDDFFDDDNTKQNGEVPVALQNGDVAPPTVSDNETVAETETETATETNADDGDEKKEDETESNEVKQQQQEEEDGGDVAAVGVDGEDGESKVNGDQEAAGEPVGHQEEPADEGFQSTSPLPTTEGVESTSPLPTTESEPPKGEENHTDTEAEKEAPQEEQEIKDSEPEPQDKNSETGDDAVKADTEPHSEVKGSTEEDGGHDYEDSFSECSQKSLASIDSTGKTMNAKIEVEQNEADQNSMKDEPIQDPQTSLPSSPAPCDSRAEAGSVVAMVVEQNEITDGRSSVEVEVKENGEYRGEDRTEVSLPDGTEDSRGQGQWQTAEQQYFASAVQTHKSEQDAFKEMEEERDKLLEDQKDMKIKDLQERLAILARENEEKDERICKLTEKLNETTNLLKDTERKLVISEQARAAADPEAPKSKTCVIM